MYYVLFAAIKAILGGSIRDICNGFPIYCIIDFEMVIANYKFIE